ncbi:hypothetical protein AB0B92_24310 [Streptomyces hygroscopicus]|uniref:hypothetical protein n=1 Tax=Streptomyces hygroscopicus TaxID=1912 RepID=UPI0033E97A23
MEHDARVLAGDAEDVAGQDQGAGLGTAGGCPRGPARGEVVRVPGVEDAGLRDAVFQAGPAAVRGLSPALASRYRPVVTGRERPGPLPWGRGRCFAAPAGALCPHISPSADWG